MSPFRWDIEKFPLYFVGRSWIENSSVHRDKVELNTELEKLSEI
jgi:hypothetical protein